MSSPNCYGVLEQYTVNNDAILQSAEEIANLGYAVVESGYTVSQVEEISRVFDIVHTQYVNQYGKPFLEKIDELNGIRLPLAFDQLFLDLAFNPIINSLLKCLIRGKFYLNQQNAIINPPGQRYNQDLFHRDLPYQHFVSSRPLAINALFCVDDFTRLNGATIVVPCSHKLEEFPSDCFVEKHAVSVEAPAGSFIVLDCMVFHKGSFNNTEKPRRAVNHVYTIPYLKQQINIPYVLNPAIDLDDHQREILGYRYQVPNGIDDYLQSRSKPSYEE
jgi:ectoine hydroxylase-related dioxygenase (phytanoyl-CoA dioxygenase family)